MAACYHDQVHFSDPVFPDLDGDRAKGMWRMLCERADDLEISFGIEDEQENGIRVRWEASYTFTKTGRPVVNKVTAHILVVNGKIISHHDHFDFWVWSRQALGLPGLLLGWTPFLKAKVRKDAARVLDRYLKES